jgi:heptosyltransferase-2
MKLLVILPNWLGDAVMATPSIEHIVTHNSDVSITLVGSFVTIEALKNHPNVSRHYIDETKKAKSRWKATKAFANELGEHDVAISYRTNIFTSLLLKWTKTPITISRKSTLHTWLLTNASKLDRSTHLVEQYTTLARLITKSDNPTSDLKLHFQPQTFAKPMLGINPGATYGSAKRWYPKEFAKVGAHYASRYDIIIFGGPTEVEMGDAIETELHDLGVTNVINVAGKTTIQELCEKIGGLSLFITNDSGPMHVAAAYKVPTVAIFGPTRDHETSQWHNPKGVIVKKEIDCAPCMKRECPLGHHACMKEVTSVDVIEAVKI